MWAHTMSPPFCDTFDPVSITLYQCVQCKMTSHLSGVIERHQRKLCGEVGIARTYTKVAEIDDEQPQPPLSQECTPAPDLVPHHAAPMTVTESNNVHEGFNC